MVAMEKNLSFFDRQALAIRKREGQVKDPPWLQNYLNAAYYPKRSDVSRLRKVHRNLPHDLRVRFSRPCATNILRTVKHTDMRTFSGCSPGARLRKSGGCLHFLSDFTLHFGGESQRPKTSASASALLGAAHL